MTYHNTTDDTGRELVRLNKTTCKQEDLVLEYIRLVPAVAGYTASELHRSLIEDKVLQERVPITSVRRALTNLSKSQKLYKTGTQRVGPYGIKEYAWKLVTPEQIPLGSWT